MINARGRKVIADLWVNKTRTLLVIFTIMTSLTAVGITLNARALIEASLNQSMADVIPAHVRLDADPFNVDLLAQVRAHPEVGDVDARYRLDLRAAAQDDEWRNLRLFALPDFANIHVNKIFPQAGAWPPAAGELALERATMTYLEVELGDTVAVQTPQGTQLEMVVTAVIHDPYQITPLIGQEGVGYIAMPTLAAMGEPTDLYNQLYLIGKSPFSEKSQSQALGVAVRRDLLEPAGLKVFRAFILEPNAHPLGEIIQVLLVLLISVGFTTLFMSIFLVINTISAILTEQTRQMGVMKAMGARATQLMGMYLLLAVLFGLLALIVGIPLSIWGGAALARFMLNFLNLDTTSTVIFGNVILVECFIGLLLPLLAALWPIFRSTRTSVLEAMSSYGIGADHVGRSFLGRLIEKAHFISRPLLLAFRNISRRRVRLILTLSALGLGGAMFISMMALRASMRRTVDDMAHYWQYDVEINLNDMVEMTQLAAMVSDVPEVADVEGWLLKEAFFVRADGSENENLWLFAPADGSSLIQPTLLEGRWLRAGDQNKIVVNSDFLREEPDVKMGDTIGIKVDSQLSEWEVVGVVTGQISGPVLYANYPALAQAIGVNGRVNRMVVETAVHDQATQSRVRQAVEDRLRENNISIGITATNAELRSKVNSISDIFFAILMVMIALLVVAGGLSVAGMMSLNVLERTKEIGILRAIGASNTVIRKLILFEALFVGVLSWIVGTLIGIPLSRLLSDLSGVGFIGAPLNFQLPTSSIVLWFVLALLLSVTASLWPAYRASALSIRDTLTYE